MNNVLAENNKKYIIKTKQNKQTNKQTKTKNKQKKKEKKSSYRLK